MAIFSVPADNPVFGNFIVAEFRVGGNAARREDVVFPARGCWSENKTNSGGIGEIANKYY